MLPLLLSVFCSFIVLARSHVPLPNITLPWGTWQSTQYDSNGDFYTFENIRFGKPPTGDLRFRASESPDPIDEPETLQNSTYGPTCIQIDVNEPCAPGPDELITTLAKSNLSAGLPPFKTVQDEDCLFLDVYVPRKVLEGKSAPAPVVVWIYGGAFVYGGKNEFGSLVPLYNGTGWMNAGTAAGHDMIFVVGNYRVGAYGWLAGKTMEKEGTPNAGLSDQRLLLQWVQDYIHLFNGDKKSVSAWGQSAGAGSIMHHLLAEKGTRDPLFRKAIMQSPAVSWSADRFHTMEGVFNNFTVFAGCESGDIQCLRDAPAKDLIEANQDLFVSGTQCTGVFDVGPSLDGILIHDLPPLAFSKGSSYQLAPLSFVY